MSMQHQRAVHTSNRTGKRVPRSGTDSEEGKGWHCPEQAADRRDGEERDRDCGGTIL